MCELLGMSANVPTDICFSLAALIRRGGETGPHSDGWGIGFYEGRGYRSFLDPHPSANSEIARFLKAYPIKSLNVISHIRKANRGKVALENTHPFSRELWGRHWSFAHNGQLKGIKKEPLSFYRPIGTTDSEHAFCWLLDRLREEFPQRPSRYGRVQQRIGQLAGQLAQRGVFNMLLCDSEAMYTHCSTKLCWLVRQAPFGKARLLDDNLVVDFTQETSPDDVVSIIATKELTGNEDWTAMAKGEFTIFQAGRRQDSWSV